MDTFFEQIISIKKNNKTLLLTIAIWLLALALCFFAYLFSSFIGPIFILVLAGIIYGAFKLTGMLNIEYEYIITNGTLDIDKIINKSNRKRILSFELSGVTRLEKYNPNILNNTNVKNIVFACNQTDENAYLMVAEKEGKAPYYLVLSPNDKIKNAIIKYIPKFVSNNAFE